MKVLEPYLIWIKLIGIGLVLAGAASFIYDAGQNSIRVDWDKDKIARSEAQKQAVIKAVADNTAELDQKYRALEQVNKGYENSLAELTQKNADLRRDIDRNGGLRISRDVCASGAASKADKAPGAGGDNGSLAGTVQLPQRVEDDLYAFQERADKLVERMRAMREAVKAAGCFAPFN